MERKGHLLTAWCSGNGNTWISLGEPINAVSLDKVQPNYNSWVGTSLGLFAEGKPAWFDFFTCKDGFSALAAAGYSNYYGVQTVTHDGGKAVTNTSANGGWLMIAGVETGENAPAAVEVTAAAAQAGKCEIWLDDLKEGRLIATIPVSATGGENSWKAFSKAVANVTGHHDVFIKFLPGDNNKIFIRDIRFLKKS